MMIDILNLGGYMNMRFVDIRVLILVLSVTFSCGLLASNQSNSGLSDGNVAVVRRESSADKQGKTPPKRTFKQASGDVLSWIKSNPKKIMGIAVLAAYAKSPYLREIINRILMA